MPPPWGAPGQEGQSHDPYGRPTQPLPYPPPGAGYGPPPGQTPPGGYGPPPPGGGRGRGKLPLVIILVVVGVVVLGSLTAGGIAYVNANDEPSPTPHPTPTQSTSIWSPTPQPSPTLTTSAPPTKDPNRLDSRSTDSRPLTLSEMFPKTFRGASGYTYTRYKTFHASACSSGRYVEGAKLRRVLSSGKCNQLLVATYVDRKHNIQTNAGVANLVDSAHARAASRTAKVNGPYFKLLRAPSPWHTRYVFDQAHGHYMQWEIVAKAKGKTTRSFGGTAFRGFVDMQALLDRPLDKR